MKTDHIERKPLRVRDDIDPAKTWVVSDTHFGHNETINAFYYRPEDHEQAMIAEWRKVIGPDDTVLHLGDLNYGGNARFKNLTAEELTGGRKLLIQGNHDRQRYSFYKQSGWQIVQPFMIGYAKPPDVQLRDGAWKLGVIEGEGPVMSRPHPFRVSFSHYPWNDEVEGGPMPDNHLRVHGHIHNIGYTRDAYVPFLKGHVNMSMEQTRYSPVRLDLLLDAVLLGKYPETTDEQIEEARRRKAENLIAKGQA